MANGAISLLQLVRGALLVIDIMSQTIEPLIEGLDASQFSSSSEFDDGCYDQLSTYSTTSSWCAGVNTVNNCGSEWLQVDFGLDTKFVFSVGTKANKWDEYVKTYYTIRYSENVTWNYYNNAELLIGNNDSEQEKLNTFSTPIIAKRVRIYPQSASGHCSLNWELYGYDSYTNTTNQSTNEPTTLAPYRKPFKGHNKRPAIEVVQITSLSSTETDNDNHLKDLTKTNSIVAAILLFAVALPLSLFLIYKHKIATENRKELHDALRTVIEQVGQSENLGEVQRKKTMNTDAAQQGEASMYRKSTVIAMASIATADAHELSSFDVDALFEEPPGLCANSEANKSSTNSYIHTNNKTTRDFAHDAFLLPQSSPNEQLQSVLDATEEDLNNDALVEYNKLVSWLLEHKLGSLLKNEAFMDQVTSINDILLLTEAEIFYFMEECGFRLLEKKKFLKIFNALNHNELNSDYIASQPSISHSKSSSSCNSDKGLLHDDPSQINIIISNDVLSYNKIDFDVASDSDSLHGSIQQMKAEEKDLPSSTDEENHESLKAFAQQAGLSKAAMASIVSNDDMLASCDNNDDNDDEGDA